MKDEIAKYGWTYHYVFDDDSYPCGTNAHTHGFETKYKHLNIQICLNIDPKLVKSLFCSIADQLEAGACFIPGQKYDKIIANYNVVFAYAYSCEELVLRLIIPDATGGTDSEPYKQQWKGTLKYHPNHN